MHLIDGNIFEAMRLVLPEHRELMSDLEGLKRIRQRPELVEDVVAEFEYMWREAWYGQSTLAITLFHSTSQQMICGIPLTYQKPLRLQTDQGCIMIQQEDILLIQRL